MSALGDELSPSQHRPIQSEGIENPRLGRTPAQPEQTSSPEVDCFGSPTAASSGSVTNDDNRWLDEMVSSLLPGDDSASEDMQRAILCSLDEANAVRPKSNARLLEEFRVDREMELALKVSELQDIPECSEMTQTQIPRRMQSLSATGNSGLAALDRLCKAAERDKDNVSVEYQYQQDTPSEAARSASPSPQFCDENGAADPPMEYVETFMPTLCDQLDSVSMTTPTAQANSRTDDTSSIQSTDFIMVDQRSFISEDNQGGSSSDVHSKDYVKVSDNYSSSQPSSVSPNRSATTDSSWQDNFSV